MEHQVLYGHVRPQYHSFRTALQNVPRAIRETATSFQPAPPPMEYPPTAANYPYAPTCAAGTRPSQPFNFTWSAQEYAQYAPAPGRRVTYPLHAPAYASHVPTYPSHVHPGSFTHSPTAPQWSPLTNRATPVQSPTTQLPRVVHVGQVIRTTATPETSLTTARLASSRPMTNDTTQDKLEDQQASTSFSAAPAMAPAAEPQSPQRSSAPTDAAAATPAPLMQTASQEHVGGPTPAMPLEDIAPASTTSPTGEVNPGAQSAAPSADDSVLVGGGAPTAAEKWNAGRDLQMPVVEPTAAFETNAAATSSTSTSEKAEQAGTPVAQPGASEAIPDPAIQAEEAEMKKRGTKRKAPKARQPPPTKKQAQTPRVSVSPQYERARNTRRGATKEFRETPRPRAQHPRPSLVVKLPVQSSPARPALQTPQTPNTGVKRKPPVEGTPRPATSPKRRKPSFESVTTPTAAVSESDDHANTNEQTPSSNQSAASDDGLAIPDPRLSAGQPVPLAEPTRPKRDVEGDGQFVEKMKTVLEIQAKKKAHDMGRRQANRILALLKQASSPSETEAKFLSTEEAEEAVSANKFFNGPIFTEAQQPLPLHSIDDFFEEYYDDQAEVWIQDPAIKPSARQPVTRKVKMSKVKDRLAAKTKTGQPWNCLELATHCEDGLRPQFLNTEDCRLLTKLKIPDSYDKVRRRTYEQGYKEVEKWALLAQAGALTEPHQDSHGYSTYITVNQGDVGFGWLSLPTPEDRTAWNKNPMTFAGGNWRYVVLKPGQTVFFPAGTVHFVFRHPSHGHTLAFGGHILRCSNIVHWVNTLIEERDEKNVTNEDLTDSSSGYLERVERFVVAALANGKAEKWGGEQAIEEFLKLKKVFLQKKQK